MKYSGQSALVRMQPALVLLMVAFLGPQAYGAGNLDDNNLRNDLLYDFTNGNVELHIPDLTGTGPIVQFTLATDSSFDLTDGFVTQGLDCALILPAVACGTEQVISYDDPTNVGFDGMLQLGRILPPDLTGPDVQNFLTEASYRNANIPTSTEFDIRVIPEPSGLILLMLAGLWLDAPRRVYKRISATSPLDCGPTPQRRWC